MERRHPRRWPVALRHNGRDFLTTAQVARVLGVKPQTVYAYVSRGRLESVRIAGMRGSLFPVADVEAFRGRTAARPPAGVVERIRTELTLIENDSLYYRGRDAVELAWSTEFLDVAELLWGSTAGSDHRGSMRDVLPPDLPVTGRTVDGIRLMVDLLGAADERRGAIASDAVAYRAMCVLDAVIEALPVVGPSGRGLTTADRLWRNLSPMAATPRRVALLNAALVLLADHDLSAGTVAARVAASARGSIYAVISAGLGAFDGPLHGGATTLAYEFLVNVLADPRGPEKAVQEHLSEHDTIPGCGHIVYRTTDPRAEALLAALAADGARRDISDAVEAIRSASDRVVNSDLALAAVALRYRMRPDAGATIFAIARIVGWVAHAIEEYREPQLRFRPQGVYTGIRPAH